MNKRCFLIFCYLPLIVACGLVSSTPSVAIEPEELLSDPALEARARALSAELRCLVCQNQSIDDSDAELAIDLRTLVRQQLLEGQTNEEIKLFLTERFGEFILLKPPLSISTLLLWLSPFLFLALGLMAILLYRRKGSTPRQEGAPLTEAEKAALARIHQDQ